MSDIDEDIDEEDPQQLCRRVQAAEAWIHSDKVQEEECTREQIAFLDEVFYKGRIADVNVDNKDEEEEEEDDPLAAIRNHVLGKLGYDKFTRYLSRMLQRDNPLGISPKHILWYYNRNTIAQIYFRTKAVATRQRKRKRSKPLYRSFDPLAELQLDTFAYRNATRVGQRDYDDLRPGHTHVLVGVDPSTRVGFARAITGGRKTGPIAAALVAMVPDDVQRTIKLIRTDGAKEFVGLLAQLKNRGWNFPQPNIGEDGEEMQEGDPEVIEYSAIRTVSELWGLRHQQENKAGTMVTGSWTSPTMMAPVETMVRTVRELIEAWVRAGDRKGETWKDILPKLMVMYNHTIHAAFGNKHTPYQVLENPVLQQRYKAKNDRKRSRADAEDEVEGLRAGDFVRIHRVEGAFTKQSLPDWSYDVYRVKDEYEDRPDFAHVPLKRVRQLNREEVYQDPPAENVEEPPPVHYSRLAMVKTIEVEGRPGQTLDPPPDTRWLGFFRTLDTRNYTDRQGKEGDYTQQLGADPARERENRMQQQQRREQRRQEQRHAPPPEPRRSTRERRAPQRYGD